MRIRRALWGYSPSAVRGVMARIEQHYWRIAEELSMQPVVADVQRVPFAILVRLALVQQRSWSRIPKVLFGCQVESVETALADIHLQWQNELQRLEAETEQASVEMRRSGVRTLPDTGPQEQSQPHVQPLAEPQPERESEPREAILRVATAPATRAAPLPRYQGAPTLRVVKQRPVKAWRPGAIEDLDGLREAVFVREAAPQTRLISRRAPIQAASAMAQVAMSILPVERGLEAQVSGGIAGRIELLFQRFLTGKLVGEDLVLPSGQVLATRNSLITWELVAEAQQAGLLPVLIANMTIPGLSDE